MEHLNENKNQNDGLQIAIDLAVQSKGEIEIESASKMVMDHK
jgi:hypothetical protein